MRRTHRTGGIAMTLLLGAACVGQTQTPVTYKGFGFVEMGDASLAVFPDRLEVSNIGSSGLDGVEMDMGESDGVRLRFLSPIMPRTRAQTVHLHLQIDGNAVESTEDVQFASDPVGGGDLDVLIGNTGGDRVIVRALLNGALVAQSEIFGDPVGTPILAASFVGTPEIAELEWFLGEEDGQTASISSVELASPIDVILGGLTAPTQATAMIFVRIPGLMNPPPPSSARLTGLNLSTIQIMDASLRKFGSNHTGEAAMKVRPLNDRLVLSNIGATGDDGVVIEPQSDYFEIQVDPGSTRMKGDFTRDTTSGKRSRVILDVDSAGAFELLFGEVGDPVKAMAFMLGKLKVRGDMMMNAGDPDLPIIVGRAPNPDSSSHHSSMGWDNTKQKKWATTIRFDQPIAFEPIGQPPIMIDRIVFTTQNPPTPGPFYPKVKVNLAWDPMPARAEGEYIILDESLAACPTDLTDDGVTDGADLAELLSFWGQSAALVDFNGDGIVDGADLAQMLAAWGPCP